MTRRDAVNGSAPREPRHAPRVIAGLEIDFCECTFHAVNGATSGITCVKHATPERAGAAVPAPASAAPAASAAEP